MTDNRLELIWYQKNKRENIEPRILIEKKRYGDSNNQNMLIFGDNLLALKALEQKFFGKIKCIYIDPPYNTKNAYEYYNDGIEHSLWLSLMRERLELLRNLLTEEGSIWISIDADEGHYLKVLCDEIFGRECFIDEVIWQRAYATKSNSKTLSRCHDIILVYCKNKEKCIINSLPRTEEANSRYKNYDNDPRGSWKPDNLSCMSNNKNEKYNYQIITPSGRVCYPPKGRSWRVSNDKFKELVMDNRIWFGKDGTNVPSFKCFLSEVKQGMTATTLWTYKEVGHTDIATKEIKKLFSNVDPFPTAKPEKLISRILTLGSNEGDFVLDSFLGSGTTAAVAHKMKRNWIGIEKNIETMNTFCLPRLQKVIYGDDKGGITKEYGWEKGGGFTYYELAPPLIVKDEYDIDIISKEYTPQMLVEATCKLFGYQYIQKPEIYWKQGISNETSFIYITTRTITEEFLEKLSIDIEGNHLLICCGAYVGTKKDYGNITIKKIPEELLKKYTFENKNYDLPDISNNK